jgi:DNA-binding winged helix-turn-helix (wHTH) protein
MLLNTNELFRFDEFGLDLRRRVLMHHEEPVSLTPKAIDILAFLVLNPGRVVTKEEILQAVWPGSFVEENNLPKYISQLRRALGEKSHLIVTVPGCGYQLAAQVFSSEVETEITVDDTPEQRPGDIYVQHVRERIRVAYEEVPTAQLASRETALLNEGTNSRHRRVWRWVAASALAGALIEGCGHGRAHPQASTHRVLPPEMTLLWLLSNRCLGKSSAGVLFRRVCPECIAILSPSWSLSRNNTVGHISPKNDKDHNHKNYGGRPVRMSWNPGGNQVKSYANTQDKVTHNQQNSEYLCADDEIRLEILGSCGRIQALRGYCARLMKILAACGAEPYGRVNLTATFRAEPRRGG